MTEYEVYCAAIDTLASSGWKILCACPPGGTDTRYRKCLFPRRELGGSEKGPRDEVDIAAYKQEIILLLECKPKLSQSILSLNALGENDIKKLHRITSSFSPQSLGQTIQRATGVPFASVSHTAPMIAVGVIDMPIPKDVSLLAVSGEITLRLHQPLSQHLFTGGQT